MYHWTNDEYEVFRKKRTENERFDFDYHAHTLFNGE